MIGIVAMVPSRDGRLTRLQAVIEDRGCGLTRLAYAVGGSVASMHAGQETGVGVHVV